MLKFYTYWPACLIALTLFGVGIACSGPLDAPVSSGNDRTNRTDHMEGVKGRVTAPDGAPIVGALLQPKSLDVLGPPIPEIAVLTESDGRYTWPLLPGNYEMAVLAEGYQHLSKPVTVKAGQAATVDFRLERKP